MNSPNRLIMVRKMYRVTDVSTLTERDRTQIRRHALALFRKEFGLKPVGGFRRWSVAVENGYLWIMNRIQHQLS